MNPGIGVRHRAIAQRLACPICLGRLTAEEDHLACLCGATYPLIEGVPVFLVQDAHEAIKRDEIAGEVAYNVAIPQSVHEARNVLVDGNTEEFVKNAGIGLSGKEILVVGCSMGEMRFWSGMGARPLGLDIGPRLVLDCDRATQEHYKLDASWVCGDENGCRLRTTLSMP